MKKIIKSIVILVVLVLVVGLIGFFFLNGMIKGGVETVLPEITGTPVKVESVNISVVSGKAEISGFLIGNPDGFKTENAFSLDGVNVALDVPSIFSDEVVIEEIRITAPKITYEKGLDSSNISKIKENVDKYASKGGGGDGEGEDPGTTGEGTSKKVRIKRIVLEEGEIAVSIVAFQGKTVALPLPAVNYEPKDDEARPVGEVAQDLFGVIAKAIEDAVVNGKDAIAQGVKDLGAGGQEAVENAAGDAKAAVEKAAGDAAGGLGDLLKKK